MKKIHLLKKEKEALAVNYEQEEEFLTNDLSRKLAQVNWCYCQYSRQHVAVVMAICPLLHYH